MLMRAAFILADYLIQLINQNLSTKLCLRDYSPFASVEGENGMGGVSLLLMFNRGNVLEECWLLFFHKHMEKNEDRSCNKKK